MSFIEALSDNFRHNTTNIKALIDANSPVILLATGIIGFGVAIVGVAKRAPKAKEELDIAKEAREENRKTVAIAEDTAIIVRNYWREGLIILGSAASLIFSYKEMDKRLAATAALNAAAWETLATYKDKVKEELGERKAEKIDQKVVEEIANDNSEGAKEVVAAGPGEMLCKDWMTGRYFSSSKDTIREVEQILNRRLFSGREYFISQNEMWDELNMKHVGYGDEIGFTMDCPPEFSMDHANLAEDGRPCCVIMYNMVPKPNGYF